MQDLYIINSSSRVQGVGLFRFGALWLSVYWGQDLKISPQRTQYTLTLDRGLIITI